MKLKRYYITRMDTRAAIQPHEAGCANLWIENRVPRFRFFKRWKRASTILHVDIDKGTMPEDIPNPYAWRAVALVDCEMWRKDTMTIVKRATMMLDDYFEHKREMLKTKISIEKELKKTINEKITIDIFNDTCRAQCATFIR